MSIEPTCHCGSPMPFESCCQVYIKGTKLAPDPETLMRSRYTAFVLNSFDYLKSTWHPDTVPQDLHEDEYSTWVRLEVIETAIDEDGVEGEVEFIAKLIIDDKLETLHELSHFDKIDGKWLYHSGDFKNEGNSVQKISKSSQCPCNSGKVFKNCHMNK